MAFALVSLKIGYTQQCYEELERALRIYQTQLGEFEFKTKEANRLLLDVERVGMGQHQ